MEIIKCKNPDKRLVILESYYEKELWEKFINLLSDTRLKHSEKVEKLEIGE